MATRPKTGSKNGIEWRTETDGTKSYRWVLNLKSTGKRHGSWTTSNAEARAGRVKAQGEAQAGTLGQRSPLTVREAWQAFLTSAESGALKSHYKPGTIRAYKAGWKHVDPELGAHRLDAVKRADVQALVDRWIAEGATAATVRNQLQPLRTVYRGAIKRDLLTVDPTANIDTPKIVNEVREVVPAEEAAKLIAAAPEVDRALWATAFYGGLRRGELMALRWKRVHFADAKHGPYIDVQRSWDDREGEVLPKSVAGQRKVPISAHLAAYLKALPKGKGEELVFGRSAAEPFAKETVRRRALKAWTDAGLTPTGLHPARHTFASFLIASGANALAVTKIMGHETVQMTFDLYGHLMPGAEEECGRLLDAYLSA